MSLSSYDYEKPKGTLLEEYFSVDEACLALGVTKETLKNYRKKRGFPSFIKLGQRCYVPKAALANWVKGQTDEPPHPRDQLINVIPSPPREGRVMKYMVDALVHRDGSSVEIVTLYVKYTAWCVAQNLTPLKPAAFNDELFAAVCIAGLKTRQVKAALHLVNVGWIREATQ